MRALRDTVVLALETVEMRGGIMLPEKYRGTGNDMSVLLVGPEVKDIEVGDVVLKPDVIQAAEQRANKGTPGGGHKTIHDVAVVRKIDGRQCIVVQEEDITIVVETASQRPTTKRSLTIE